ncbi:protein trapped in endoderm-1 isoform X2 [Lucilia cuprina]|uniref:protein trapped in endoderm-1 isoform X2 n=1 Tax=Lucilia cuprina TaxID=7375 RepID=UPI001F069EB1|nr:protein trapped in endoderm-1 isoform X2 [Lucilia cuprina]
MLHMEVANHQFLYIYKKFELSAVCKLKMESQSIYPHSATLFAAICACLFIVVGIFGNLITMFALMRSPKIRCHATTAFVLSLCISDLLFCSFSLPLTAVRFFKEFLMFDHHYI